MALRAAPDRDYSPRREAACKLWNACEFAASHPPVSGCKSRSMAFRSAANEVNPARSRQTSNQINPVRQLVLIVAFGREMLGQNPAAFLDRDDKTLRDFA